LLNDAFLQEKNLMPPADEGKKITKELPQKRRKIDFDTIMESFYQEEIDFSKEVTIEVLLVNVFSKKQMSLQDLIGRNQ
jgi:hypothetical protein